jgi:hypothetical protein
MNVCLIKRAWLVNERENALLFERNKSIASLLRFPLNFVPEANDANILDMFQY